MGSIWPLKIDGRRKALWSAHLSRLMDGGDSYRLEIRFFFFFNVCRIQKTPHGWNRNTADSYCTHIIVFFGLQKGLGTNYNPVHNNDQPDQSGHIKELSWIQYFRLQYPSSIFIFSLLGDQFVHWPTKRLSNTACALFFSLLMSYTFTCIYQ